ncbi:chemotaxis protein CheA [Pueribacillus theae]|uniref:Chemotaxis protein CheA n=1 Tax=Pueribacillus theae TaxID=2171751 RepID=A0A2U1K873_9BACI|nr:chemotaxis protein CheA [Pueribacillus theae]PWA13524.1 chemotaxis protein CheA [Pueribacillus theae]
METNQYLEVFLDESREHLQSVNDHLLNLENNPEDLSYVQEVFRSAHTLKGMAATMGYEDIANLTHKMENVLDDIRNEKLKVSSRLLDILLEAVEALENMIASISSGGDGKQDVTHLVSMLEEIGNEDALSSEKRSKESATKGQGSESIILNEFEKTLINESKEQGFDSLFIKVTLNDSTVLKAARTYMVFDVLEKLGEVIKSEPSVEKLEEEEFDYEFSLIFLTKESPEEVKKKILKVSEIKDVSVTKLDSFTGANKQEKPESRQSNNKNKGNSSKSPKVNAASTKTIRVNIDRLDQLMNLFEELVIDRGRLEEIAKDLNNKELSETVEKMTRISGDLQSIILTMRMMPIEQVFNRFPRMIRGLAKDLNKKVKLDIIGAETELDRTVIDEIGDPLVHLLRNSLDHGIELPEVREKANKDQEGLITLKAYQSGNHVFIEIEDDGAGINTDKVINKVVQNGVMTKQEADKLTDEEIFQLIFSSGFSTAEQVSDVSGRGVGLDVVKSKIESLGGNVSVESERGKGSRFIIQLPLTLSIISVLLIEIGNEKYAIPLSSIIETAILHENEVLFAHNQNVIDFRGKIVPLIFLDELFEIQDQKENDEYYSIVIVKKGDKMAALVVDAFIGQQEVVLKSLGNYLTNVFAISGATILGNGQVALIIDCNALIK